ncbi:DinB family protein [Heyndrickxia camelliae]|uniref:DinB family protein n=1 Tax=Heyndrickxia camelliae TaxID=1707093 RepID=A0A2N3LLA9_9BACI|nr:DinB family protein [Heyndrickxia camelliae]PKR85313.1 DinB family protein [Heyndrickxia camelliae]
MQHYLFDQLYFVRNNTLNELADVTELQSEVIPEGFNNNIKWNAGHIFFIQEKFSFHFAGEEMSISEEFSNLFCPGSIPEEGKENVPTIEEIKKLLSKQVERVEKNFKHRLNEISPIGGYTTSKGLPLLRVEEFLSFCLYHEGMHFEKIKILKKMIYS